MEWLQDNWVALSGIGLLALRLVESVLVLLKADKALDFIAIVKEFFRIG